MNPDERERLMSLCEKIAKETNHKKFTELTLELSYLIERNGDELKRNDAPSDQPSDQSQ